MKKGDKVSGMGFSNCKIEEIYQDTIATGNDRDYVPATMVAVSNEVGLVKHIHLREIAEIIPCESEVVELKSFNPKWEYKFIEGGGSFTAMKQILDKSGQDGWEAIQIATDGSSVLMKRIKYNR